MHSLPSSPPRTLRAVPPVLLEFLGYPLTRTNEIFARFAQLPGAAIYGKGRERVLYVEGSRPVASGRCLLVAHADTVWDETALDSELELGTKDDIYAYLRVKNGVIRSGAKDRGIGADDRAGLAMLWALKDLGHSLLITDLEEAGRLGSEAFARQHPQVLDEIHRTHAFAVQFDRCHGRDFKCYRVGSRAFRAYLHKTTGYDEPDKRSATDICTLCKATPRRQSMCGVNLSVGYYDEHSPAERLVIDEWKATLAMAETWLGSAQLPSFRRAKTRHAHQP